MLESSTPVPVTVGLDKKGTEVRVGKKIMFGFIFNVDVEEDEYG